MNKNFIFGALLVFILALVVLGSATITSVTLNSPANNVWTNSISHVFNFRAISDSDPTFSCDLVVDGTPRANNPTVANNTNTDISPMIGLPQGKHDWKITCRDSSGVDKDSATRTLYIDTTDPNVTLIDPEDDYNSSSTSVDFKFKVTDNLDTSLDCKLYVDGDEEKSGTVSNDSQTTWTVIVSRDTHNWQVKCEDNAGNEGSSATWGFEIREVNYCEEGEVGDGLTLTVEEPDENDEFSAGENISVKVTVENTAGEDLEVVIKAELYDVQEEDTVSTSRYDTEIAEDDEKTYTLQLKVPTTIDPDDDFVVNVKVYEDGNEDMECKEDSINVDITQESHKIVISSFSLNPITVECGDAFSASLKIENVGENDESVKITVKNSELKVDSIKTLNLDSGDDYSETLNFNVPSNASEKDYSIVMTVYYDENDDVYDKTVSDTATLTVHGGCSAPETKDVSISQQQISEAFNGKEFIIKVNVINTGTVETTYTINASNYESWATLARIEPSTITLNGGSSGYAYVTLVPLANASGANTLKIKVTFGTTTKEEIVTVTVKQQSTAASLFEQLGFWLRGNWKWAIVDILLVVAVVALFVVFLRHRARTRRMSGQDISTIRVRTINEKDFRKAKKK